MKRESLYQYVDHTLLRPTSTFEEIKRLCTEALTFHMASVCIPGCFVKNAHEKFPQLTICTVVGFPLGYSSIEAKMEETRQALSDGASEIDMVINLGFIKEKRYTDCKNEIIRIKELTGDRILKVIVEACYLSEEEKREVCKIVTEAGADFIKTSTGFGTGGAQLEDVILFKNEIGPEVKIKAAGGIRTMEDMEAFIEAGCSRIGTSNAIDMLK